MIKNGVMFSIEECKVIYELILSGREYWTKEDYQKLTREELDLVNQLQEVIREDE